MPRTATLASDDIIESAMRHFWMHGYHATSIDDLVRATGASRHAIYQGVGNKHALYHRGFAAYQASIVTPAFACVERQGAGLADIEHYLLAQIALAEAMGLPGPGCLVANAATETAPHDPVIADAVAAHQRRLQSGFRNALDRGDTALAADARDALADFLVIAVQGLWSHARTVSTAAPLRAHVATLMALLRGNLNR